MLNVALQGGIVFAQDSGGEPSGFSPSFLIVLLVLGGVFYALFILPSRRRSKQRQAMQNSISVGDEVRTIGGIFGTIREEIGDSYVIDVGGGTTMRVAKRAVAERIGDDAE